MNMSTSLNRALDILLLFGDPEVRGLAVSEVARRLDIDKSVASRTLSTLAASGFLAKNPLDSRQYVLGPAIARLGEQASEGVSLLNLARPRLVQLQAMTKETVSLQVRRDRFRYCIDQVESPLPIRRVVEMNTPLPLHQGSSGTVLLAFAKDSERDGLVDAVVPEGDRAALRARLERARELGYAKSLGERVDGISGISAPILNAQGVAVAAMAISGPAIRLSEADMMSYVDELLRCTRALSMHFGAVYQGVDA